MTMSESTPVILSMTDRVRLHIAGNPGCHTPQIANALDIGCNAANTMGMRLRDQGLVTRYYVEGERRPRWKEGRDPNLIQIDKPKGRGYYKERTSPEHRPNQKQVAQWEPCKVRDPLIDLLFGRNA